MACNGRTTGTTKVRRSLFYCLFIEMHDKRRMKCRSSGTAMCDSVWSLLEKLENGVCKERRQTEGATDWLATENMSTARLKWKEDRLEEAVSENHRSKWKWCARGSVQAELSIHRAAQGQSSKQPHWPAENPLTLREVAGNCWHLFSLSILKYRIFN